MSELMKEALREEEHDNVMFLAMSTLPYQPRVNVYQPKGKKLFFKSISQMEPHTKYVLYTLAARGEKLDRIVILESGIAREEKPENWGGETATTFYTKRIHSYLGSLKEEDQVSLEVAGDLAEPEETMMNTSLYQAGFPEIITIDLDEEVYFWKAVQAIRGTGHDRVIHLYMDMQGGDRNSVSQMNAIVELLERQKVSVQKRYANDFKPGKSLHTIREVSDEYRTYELISAMDIFVRYGWGDKLEQYFKKVRPNTREGKLLKAINQASKAISKCNGDDFDLAVSKIEKLKEEFKKPETVTEMDVVYQDIHENYKSLINTKHRYVAQIRWCLDKKFLQQALTIFEAKMPYEFILSGLVYYMADGDRARLFNACEQIYLRMPSREHYRMKDLNHYLIKEYCKGYDNSGQPCFKDECDLLTFGLEDRKEDIIALLNQYRDLCGLRNQINHAAVRSSGSDENGDSDVEGFFKYMKKKYSKDKNWKNQSGTNYEKQIRDFLEKWEQLADLVPKEISSKIVDMS